MKPATAAPCSSSSTDVRIYYTNPSVLEMSYGFYLHVWNVSNRRSEDGALNLSQFAVLTTTESCANLVGLSIVWTLSILGQLDVLNHFSKKRVAVVFVLGHQHFQHKPEAPTHTSTHTFSCCLTNHFHFFCTNHHSKQMNQPVLTLWCLSAGRILVVL